MLAHGWRFVRGCGWYLDRPMLDAVVRAHVVLVDGLEPAHVVVGVREQVDVEHAGLGGVAGVVAARSGADGDEAEQSPEK